MAMHSYYGMKIEKVKKMEIFEYFFGEDQGRYILEVEHQILLKLKKLSTLIYYENIGYTQKKYFEIEGEFKININDLSKMNNQWYNNY